MNKDPKRIETGSKVAIIGGGPAGTLFALCLLNYARERGIHPEVTIFEQRNFDSPGPKGCKGCAGILSQSLFSNLGELGLSVPEEIIQSKIEHYTVHSPYTSIRITKPKRATEIASIYRGGGPRISHYDNSISFDGWLLGQAQRQGVQVENQKVSRIYLKHEARVEVEGKELKYDLVVLASGVNTRPIPIEGVEYSPPKTRIMAQDELYLGTDEVESQLGNTAHVFLIPHSGMTFGTLVPKGPFVNVSVLTSSGPPISVNDFLSHDIVRGILSDHYERACGCRPRITVSPAHNYYADRFVAVGDAALSRLYKDGIGSSLLAAREAARTAIYYGLSRKDFKHHYQPFCNALGWDNRWGRLLFSINDSAKNSRAFLLSQHRLIGVEQDNVAGPQPFTKVIWGMFTGNYSYRRMTRMALNPLSLSRLTRVLFKEILKGLIRRGVTYPRRLHIGSKKVVILGSGFGGMYALKHLVHHLNRNENVETTMVSNENFFLFSPLLHEVAMGRIETRHIAYPIRRLHWRDRFNFVQADVQRIDLGARSVITTEGTLDFDYLVLALGSDTDISGLSALSSNVFTLKTLHDAMLVRNHIIGIFERASVEREPERQRQLLTFIVCGGGYTGIQLVTELRDFIFRSLNRFYRTVDTDNIRIILVEAGRKIVAELHTKLGAYAMEHLHRMGIEVRMRSRVTRVWEDYVEINGSEIVPTSTVIWVAGILANPRIAELDVEKDDLGRVNVNQYMEVNGFPGVYAAGDCTHFEDSRSGRPIPPRAHTAVRQARVVACNILAEIRGTDRQPYRYSNTAEVLSLGANHAVLRYRGLRFYGFPARFMWLVAYSSLITGTYNRIRIVIDWLLSFLFGRDITLLKLRKL